ncbi:DNA-binding response regulator, NarL/FixJ family, contains REC and HTH domains [Rheinheimera pacifica]|uniref:DNA-binding response regulator, NarL/FixJ family, contains REC and HTH domains n=1 Tax=Rheinheimera pacifica TaxID=173990 RepID=A0A1H6L6W5_9GAMM|nr:response regulator transcription factor [Rheinheimera pacifica]SEH80960.1 DNA-binding response regulator, NarL/FixJ family, contains REC and HTH domains [Rheinheimera pacifica]
MADVLIISDTNAGLASVFSCLDLLSVSYCQITISGLSSYIQRETEPRWLLLRASGNIVDDGLASIDIKAVTSEQPLMLLVDSDPRVAEVFALDQGFIGVMSLNMTLDQMVKALRVANEGGLWYSRAALEQLVYKQLQKRRTQKLSDSLHNLTKKEKLIAKLSSEGLANVEIAASLHLSPNTVKTHMQSILRKAKVKNRTQLSALFNTE